MTEQPDIPLDSETEHTMALRRKMKEDPDKMLSTLSSGFLGVISAIERLTEKVDDIDSRLAEFTEKFDVEEDDDEDGPDNGDPLIPAGV